jgi:hypothetical protein
MLLKIAELLCKLLIFCYARNPSLDNFTLQSMLYKKSVHEMIFILLLIFQKIYL